MRHGRFFKLTSLLLLFIAQFGEAITFYSANEVENFIESAAAAGECRFSERCCQSLRQLRPLVFNGTSQRQFFYVSSFATEEASRIEDHSRFRWSLSMRKCYMAAEETTYSVSEHPMDYCFATDSRSTNKTAFAICLPSVCQNDSLQLLNQWISQAGNGSDSIDDESLWCGKSRKDVQWHRDWKWIVDFGATFFFIYLVVTVTIFDIMRNFSERKRKPILARLLLAFSMKVNIKKATALPKDKNSAVTCMAGIRVLAMYWVVLGHIYLLILNYTEDTTLYIESARTFYKQIYLNLSISVDTFFLIGGTLTSYIFFMMVYSKKKPLQDIPIGFWIHWVLNRALRLWPAYIFTLVNITFRWSQASYYSVWKGDDLTAICPKEWWKNLLFLNGFLKCDCLSWTWYIGTAFVYHIISPIYLIVFKKSQLYGLLLSVASILFSAMLNMIAIIRHNFAPVLLAWVEPKVYSPHLQQHITDVYNRPDYRVGPHIVGLILGYYLAKIRAKSDKHEISCRVYNIGWAAAAIGFFYAFYGNYPAYVECHWRLYDLIYGGFHRTLWACAWAWIIFVCYCRRESLLNRVLSHRVFIPFSNLCYSAYLIHPIAIMIVLEAEPYMASYRGDLYAIFISLLSTPFAYFFGAFIAFACEYPFNNLLNMVLYRKSKR